MFHVEHKPKGKAHLFHVEHNQQAKVKRFIWKLFDVSRGTQQTNKSNCLYRGCSMFHVEHTKRSQAIVSRETQLMYHISKFHCFTWNTVCLVGLACIFLFHVKPFVLELSHFRKKSFKLNFFFATRTSN